MQSGALLFGHYAFPPNRLGYCGPDDHQALFDYVTNRQSDKGLLELAKRFEGAFPYLLLIAQANAIPDPFDWRVVEAYWIGNAYLDRVDVSSLYVSLGERFKNRMTSRTFDWLISKLDRGARPHHNFHVFDVYMKAGLMRDDRSTITVESMDACRISWGKVLQVSGADLIVERRPLQLVGGKLALGELATVQVARQIDGRGFADEAQAGEYVSIHWNWACEVLNKTALRRLFFETQRSLSLANLTI